jgi:hypothetical protein
MSLTKLAQAKESLVSDIPAGDAKIANLFLQSTYCYKNCTVNIGNFSLILGRKTGVHVLTSEDEEVPELMAGPAEVHPPPPHQPLRVPGQVEEETRPAQQVRHKHPQDHLSTVHHITRGRILGLELGQKS